MKVWGRTLLGLFLVVLLGLVALAAIPYMAAQFYGPPAKWLTAPQVAEYSARLLWADGLLTTPLDIGSTEMDFAVQPDETIDSICGRLEQQGLVADGRTLRDYLIYTGQDRSLQSGRYRLSAAMSMVEVARRMQDATPTEVEFVVLAGWRIEEIAATLPTSGLAIDPVDFIQAAESPRSGHDFLEGATTLEGFLYPDSYVIPRSSGINDLLDLLLRRFAQALLPEIREGVAAQGLSVREAVILASIVQREAIQIDEAPLIASVYLNRLRSGMRLDADPTVQYAIGFNVAQQTWWTNPLSLADLGVESPYNTYQREGLPPAPIANPGPQALKAVAEASTSPYFFFRARCDGSGLHVFSQTFEEHLGNQCP